MEPAATAHVAAPAAGHDSTGDDSPSRRFTHVDPACEELVLAHRAEGRLDEAIAVLLKAYGKPMLAYIHRMVHDREAAKDVRQNVFIDAWRGLAEFEGRGTLWSWLCRIAYHRCVDHSRRGGRSVPETPLDKVVLDGGPAAPDPSMDPELALQRQALDQCLGQLQELHRDQVLMRYLLRLSFVEIGELVNEPPGRIQVRMSRILPRLRRCLQSRMNR